MNEAHFKECLFEHVPPPPVPETTLTTSLNTLLLMGFPTSIQFDAPVLCACHQQLKTRGYQCPRCKAFVCHLPTDCVLCGMTLISSPLLARSYHHLFPVPLFTEVPWETLKMDMSHCFACRQPFTIQPPKTNGDQRVRTGFEMTSGRFECPKCLTYVCIECDGFIHDVLHNCPGCLSQ
jgi:transcription initiation factor TFIIH subunit 2